MARQSAGSECAKFDAADSGAQSAGVRVGQGCDGQTHEHAPRMAKQQIPRKRESARQTRELGRLARLRDGRRCSTIAASQALN